MGHTLAGSGSEGADGAEAWAVAPFVVGATLSSGIGVMASGSSDTRCPFRVGWDDAGVATDSAVSGVSLLGGVDGNGV